MQFWPNFKNFQPTPRLSGVKQFVLEIQKTGRPGKNNIVRRFCNLARFQENWFRQKSVIKITAEENVISKL